MHETLLDSGDRRQFRDRRIPPTLLPLLAKMRARAVAEPYCVVAMDSSRTRDLQKFLAKQSMPFSSVAADDKQVTAVLPASTWKKCEADFPTAEVDRGYRVLAIEGQADWTAPGFVSVLGRTLAEGNVGAGFVTGFRRLHLVVKARQLKDARVYLDLLANQARGRMKGSRSQRSSARDG